MKRRVLCLIKIFFFFFLSCKVRQPLLSPLPFSYPCCPSSSQLDVIWPVNGTLLYSFLSGHVSRCREQQHLWSLQMAASSRWTWGRKLHPANTQTLCAQLNFGSLGHHWRSIACPLFFPCFFCLNEDFQRWGPVAPDSGLVGEIMNGQLGFELITLVYLGSTACWLQGSTDKKLSSTAQPDLFWPGPCGTMTPLWLVPLIEGIRQGEI